MKIHTQPNEKAKNNYRKNGIKILYIYLLIFYHYYSKKKINNNNMPDEFIS